MNQPVIVSACRTPNGSFNGSLSGLTATDLGATVITEAIKRAGIHQDIIDEVIMGQVLPCGCGQNPARQAAVKAGLPWDTACLTVNKVCGSSLKSVMLAAQAIAAGDADVVIAGGMESMSNAPYYLPDARSGYRMGNGKLVDHMVHDGLWDVVNDFHMGISNELCSEKYNVSREEQDRHAAESYKKAMKSIEEGRFSDEIIPVEVPQSKGKTSIFDTDECPRETTFEMLEKMKPAFKEGGVTTAGNSSIISDGGAAVVVMSRKKAEEHGCEILAHIGPQATYGIDMKYVLVAPIGAIPRCLDKAGLSITDIDLFEINEAFSGSSVAIQKELNIDPEKINVNGGSVALGHPIGASGCRVLVTLLYELKRQNLKKGLATLCLGGGEAVALLVNLP